jgi:protocatechuate 3,4-dioxygenase, alpha subunit
MNGRSTPSQTVGPYFSIGFSWLERRDLTEGATSGTRLTLHGRVLDGEGQPVPDAVIEIWQADADGRYSHPEDAESLLASKTFFGFGRISVNDQGEYRFTTVKPGSVPGPGEKKQAPHLEVSVFMRGLLKRLVTRVYFPGEPANETDAVLGLVPAQRRDTLVARLRPAEPETLVWDVHLQGDEETVFFDY